MATKERHAPQAGQAPAWPGPAKDPAWVGLAPEPAQAGRAHEPAWSILAPDPAQAGRAHEQTRPGRLPEAAQEPDRGGRAPGSAQAGRAQEPARADRAAEAARAGWAQELDRGGRAPGSAQAGRTRGPVWRSLLEARWRDRVQEVIELSLAYHEAASAAAADGGAPARGPAERKVRKLLRRTVAARRALADTEEALGRLTSGRYGLCEGCTGAIPARLLAAAPEARYCPRCRPWPSRAPAVTAHPARVY
jgi:RNA polymerase-binding transcription factor DksA